jgi:Uma2 family endonuclease
MATTKTKEAGTWTYDDLFALPDDGKRYEIIEGELYEMPAPNWDHIAVVMNLILLLGPVVQSHGGRLTTAPADVFFEGADPVQPDIFAMLPGARAVGGGRGVQGPPDLVIEVLSPSNRGHDLLTKRALYGRAGVSEYWIVNPASRTVDLLALDRDAFHSTRLARGEGDVVSPLLGDAAFPLAAIFTGIDATKE